MTGFRSSGDASGPPATPRTPPPPATVERWAWDLVSTVDLAAKLSPPAVPATWEESPPARRIDAPGRPAALRVSARAGKTPRAGALAAPAARARLYAGFLHHELQAAELMAWALLAFPDTPRAFRRGLLAIARDELRHLALYRALLADLGVAVGDEPVRDWFWERVPRATTPVEFVALLGMGLEGGNLEHARTFAARLALAGDARGAEVLTRVGVEEEAHVRFAVRWFERWTGGQDFERWRRSLPPPLTPTVLRGRPLARAARERAGQSPAFLDALERWEDAPRGRV